MAKVKLDKLLNRENYYIVDAENSIVNIQEAKRGTKPFLDKKSAIEGLKRCSLNKFNNYGSYKAPFRMITCKNVVIKEELEGQCKK